MPNRFTGPLQEPPEYVKRWFASGLTAGQIAVKTGRNVKTVASIMQYWKHRVAIPTREK